MWRSPGRYTSWQDLTQASASSASTDLPDVCDTSIPSESAGQAEASRHPSRFLAWLIGEAVDTEVSPDEVKGIAATLEPLSLGEAFSIRGSNRSDHDASGGSVDEENDRWSSDVSTVGDDRVGGESGFGQPAAEEADPPAASSVSAPIPGQKRRKKRNRGRKKKNNVDDEAQTIPLVSEADAAGKSAGGTSGTGPRIPLGQGDRMAVLLALKSPAARLALTHETPEVHEIMGEIWAIKADKTLTQRAIVDRLRALGARCSLETLTCSMLTQHATWHGIQGIKAERRRRGLEARAEDEKPLLPEHVEPWSVEIGSPGALQALEIHLTDEDRKLLRYFETPKGKSMEGQLLDEFVSRFSWAGKAYEAVRRKDVLLCEYALVDSALSEIMNTRVCIAKLCITGVIGEQLCYWAWSVTRVLACRSSWTHAP